MPIETSELLDDPIRQFRIWYADAEQASRGADVVALATADASAVPSVRMVNFKGWYENERGESLSFFSNYESRKGRELDENSYASMLFYWPELKRQVQVAGRCTRLIRLENEKYFAGRDREAQLSAHMSQQSRPLDSFESMEREVELLRRRFAGQPIHCPAYWGGTLLHPERFEFRLGREHRRHYRWEYERSAAGWRQRKLFP